MNTYVLRLDIIIIVKFSFSATDGNVEHHKETEKIYLLKKSKANFDNRKRKNNHDEVKKLKDEGLSAKEISERLDIPLRTVYYISNKK